MCAASSPALGQRKTVVRPLRTLLDQPSRHARQASSRGGCQTAPCPQRRVTMNEFTPIEAYGQVTEPATLTIQRILPGPIERCWAYLTQSDLRRQWLASGDMEMRLGSQTELVWHNDELTDPPGTRPGVTSLRITACPLQSRNSIRHTVWAFRWGSTGGVTFVLAAEGRQGNVDLDPSPHRRPLRAAQCQRRLARASGYSGRPRNRKKSCALLGPMAAPEGGVCKAPAGLIRSSRISSSCGQARG